jgi:hypothetical protein
VDIPVKEEMKGVRITVLMAVFNGSHYLGEAIESILNQTRGDFRFLIINDGSTEPVEDIIMSFGDPRIELHHQEHMGLPRTLNKGIGLCKGDYIARMDADDLSPPERLEAQAAELDDDENLDLIGCFFNVIDDYGKVLETREMPIDPLYRLWRLQFHNNYAHGSVMFRKSAVIAAGMYNESLTYAQDFDLWCRMSGPNNTKIIPRPLYCHRIRSDGRQTSVRHYRAQLANAASISNRSLLACNPDLPVDLCPDVRALYWKFERDTLSTECLSGMVKTFEGFCRRYGIADKERRRLERRLAQDTWEELQRVADTDSHSQKA